MNNTDIIILDDKGRRVGEVSRDIVKKLPVSKKTK